MSQSAEMAPQEVNKVVRLCNAVIRWSIRLLAALVPVFFLPWTIEVVEINKQLLILVGAGIAGLAWVGKMLAERKFEYRRSIVNSIVVLYVAVYAISAWMSKSRYTSLVGDFGQEKAGLVTAVAFAILYFVIINNIRTLKELNRVLFSAVAGGFVAAVYAILQGLGVFILPFEFAKAASFNTVGTVASLGIYLSFIITLAGGLLLSGHNQQQPGKKGKLFLAYNVFLAATAVLGLFLIAVIDYWPVTLCLLVSSALLIAFAFVHAKSMKGIGGVLLPIAALVVSLLLLIFRFPVALGYPAEIMPSMKASADITMKTLRERPLFGSGPGTFIFDYAKFHSKDVNTTYFWNIRFDRGSSRFLTSLATTGLLGTLSWLLVAVFLLVSAAKKLFKTDEETWHVLIGIFAAWFLLILAKFVYSSTITLEFATWLGMALLVVVHRRDFFTVKFENSPRAAMVLSFVFIMSLVFALSGAFVEGQRYAAEVDYANAIRADRSGADPAKVVDLLSRASNLNQSNDVFVRNLGLALLAQANQQAAAPVDVKRNKDEKDEDYQKRVDAAKQDRVREVASLAANAVNIAKHATDLNQDNVADWAVLGSIYQGLLGVTDGADDWAIKSYQQAIDLEPSNPSLYTELGKVYMYQADVAAQGEQSQDEKAKADAKKKADDLLAKAVDSFNKAIELKSDYAPAHYQLGLAFDRQGKLKDAITKMESVVAYNPQDVGVGFELALLYFRDGRKDDAIKLMESVVRLSPNFSNARWYLAAMYEDKGDPASLDKAIEQIKKVDELNPGNDLVKQKLDELNKKKAAPPAAAGGQLPPPVEQPVQNPNEPGVQH